MKKKVVIVCKELNESTLSYYVSEFKEISILVVTPKEISTPLLNNNITYKNDNDYLVRENYGCIEDTPRPNWYYQQFLKYSIVLKSECDLIHIVDGDSFVRKDLMFSELIFYSKKKVEREYSNFIKRIDEKIFFSEKNYITNQMCFNKTHLSNLISCLSNKFKDDWIVEICKILHENTNIWFSEYQFYANYVLKNNISKEQEIKVFRRFDIINKPIENGFINYSVLAMEPQHKTGFLRSIRAKIFFCLNFNLG